MHIARHTYLYPEWGNNGCGGNNSNNITYACQFSDLRTTDNGQKVM